MYSHSYYTFDVVLVKKVCKKEPSNLPLAYISKRTAIK